MMLGFKILYPNSIIADGALFISEAALVGGVADWFAVTALFKKPLGFPFHTAILPRRRQDFINASVYMVHNEFFSRRAIFKKLSGLHLLPSLVSYLSSPQVRNEIIKFLFKEITNYFSALNKEMTAKKIAGELRKALSDVEPNILLHELSLYLKKSGKDKVIFEKLITRAKELAAQPSTREKIEKLLEDYTNEHLQSSSSFSLLMASLAQALDLVNFTEAAELMQKHLVAFLEEISTSTQRQEQIISQCRQVLGEVTSTAEFHDLMYELQLNSIKALPLDSLIDNALNSVNEKLTRANVDRLEKVDNPTTVHSLLFNFLTEQFDRLIKFLEEDTPTKAAAEKVLFDLSARSALAARPIFANIAQNSLMTLSDEQLNKLVYSMAEEDFIWIRLNGSIVGSIIGLLVFITIEIISQLI